MYTVVDIPNDMWVGGGGESQHIHLIKYTYRETVVGWLLEFNVLATSKVIPGWVPTCDSAYPMRFYRDLPLGEQGAGTMTWYHIILILSQPVLALS